MLSESSFSRACRRIREHMASIVPAMMQKNPQPRPTIVLATEDLKHTLSVVDSLNPAEKRRHCIDRGDRDCVVAARLLVKIKINIKLTSTSDLYFDLR